MARTIGSVDMWRSGIILTTISIVITFVSHPEYLLFKAWRLIGFGKAITPRKHKIFKPASKSGYQNIWRSMDIFKKNSGNFQQFFVLVAFYEGK